MLSNALLVTFGVCFGLLFAGILWDRPTLTPPLGCPELHRKLGINTTTDTESLTITTGAKAAESSGALSQGIIRDYSHMQDIEAKFVSTIRNCLGSFCFDEKVSKSGGLAVDRIGILSPPMSGEKTLMKMIQKSAGKELASSASKIEIIDENHVPAYGYGKNHGWTRIIRLVHRVVPHSMVLATKASLKHDGDTAITTKLIDAQVRQLTRWHCRLSHVAAHTRMLSIFVEDLVARPAVELEKVLTFIGFKAFRPDVFAAVNDLTSDLINELQLPPNGVSSIIALMPTNIIEAATSALEDELTSTDMLTKWPCRSFREVDRMNQKLLMTAPDLAPNCSAIHVTCSVPMDNQGG